MEYVIAKRDKKAEVLIRLLALVEWLANKLSHNHVFQANIEPFKVFPQLGPDSELRHLRGITACNVKQLIE